MSPSESQLRAALSDGEGPGPDADDIIGKAVAFRRDRQLRRVRVAGVLGVVVIVAGVAIGLAATRHGTANSDLSAKAPLPGASGAVSNAAGAGTAATVPKAGSAGAFSTLNSGAVYGAGGGARASSTVPPCPASPVRYLLPGGGGTGQFGASTPLFDKPVDALTFCVYSPQTNAFKSSSSISGDAARTFVAGLDASTLQRTPLFCLTPLNVEILATDASGGALTPVAVVGTCQQALVTNGTAIRYAPISTFEPYLGTTSIAPPPPSGPVSGGSPPR